MTDSILHTKSLICLRQSFQFFRRHFLVIITLGFIAGLGRVFQLGGFGPVNPLQNLFLEVLVEGSRIFLFLYILGMANIFRGVQHVKQFFTQNCGRKKILVTMVQSVRKEWKSVLINIIGFLLVAGLINYMIELLAYKTCLYLTLKTNGILAGTSSEWTILLFFKNLAVIPLTLIFETFLLLWLCNRLAKPEFTASGNL